MSSDSSDLKEPPTDSVEVSGQTHARTIRYTSPKRAKKAGQWAMKKYAKAFKKLAAS